MKTRVSILYFVNDCRFVIVSKNCSTKLLSGGIFKIFKMLSKHVGNFRNKSTFYSIHEFFWVVENSFPIIEILNFINTEYKQVRNYLNLIYQNSFIPTVNKAARVTICLSILILKHLKLTFQTIFLFVFCNLHLDPEK